PIRAHGKKRRFVDEIREVRAGEAGRAPRSLPQIDTRREGDLPRVDLEDLLAALDVGRADGHLTVEPSWTQQRRVEDVGTIRGRHDHDSLVWCEAVHLDEQLIERLLPLFVAERIP